VIRKHFLALLFSTFFSTFLWADTIGGEASIGLYHHTLEGSSSYNTPGSVDFSDTLDFSSTQDIFLQLYIEHPFPLFPNVKLGYNTFSHDANTLVSDLSWGKFENFTGKAESSFSLSYTDITLYYELLDNWTEIDTGFTFRSLEGDMGVQTSFADDTVSYSSLIPLFYAKARFNIPSTDISFQAEGNFVTFSGITNYDYALSARYSFPMGLGFEAGYKTFHLESDDLSDNFTTDIEFSGPYLLAVWDF